MASNSREYNRQYGRIRRFLYRLNNPPKQRGPRIGYRKLRDIESIEKYDWDRTFKDEDWSKD